MPQYEFFCRSCQQSFSRTMPFSEYEKGGIACPQCGARVEWAPGSRFRPFCSERCKLIDLGAWASESYRIPAKDGGEREDRSADEGES